MQIAIVAGRGITAQDKEGGQRVSVISESLARRYFGETSPLGRRIQAGSSDDTWTTIVGVAADTVDDWFMSRGIPTIYVSFAQFPTTIVNLVARTNGDPMHLADGLRRAVATVDSRQPTFNAATMREQLHDRTVGIRLVAGLMTGLGLLALVLAAFGIYGLMANTVAQRRHEFGVRMALGASAGDVLGLTMRQGLKLIAVGVPLGLVGAFVLGRVIENALFGVLTTDLLLVAAITALLCAVALAATVIPARRASRLDPALVLRD